MPGLVRHAILLVALAAPLPPTSHAQPPGTTAAPQPARPATPARDTKPGEATRGTASIRGSVVSAETGAPLRRVQVRASNQRGAGGGLAQTDDQGNYEITDLPAGRYSIVATRAGYVTVQFGQRAFNQQGNPLELADGQRAEKVNFVLPRGGAISGAIVDELGEPIAGVNVTAQRYAFVGGSRRLTGVGGAGAFDRTDDRGEYRLFGLPPGDYLVSATFRDFSFLPPTSVASPSAREGFAPTFFPGTTNPAEARRVGVRSGQEAQNVSFALASARVGRIRGRVMTRGGGNPTAGTFVSVVPREQEMGIGTMSSGTQVLGDGSFQTPPLPPGAYVLFVGPQGPRDSPEAEVGRTEVVIAGDDVDDVVIVTGPGGIIRGRVVTDTGTAPPFTPRQMQIFPQPADRGAARSFGVFRAATVNDDWTFEVRGLADRVRLRWSLNGPPSAWSMRSALKDDIDIADTAIDVAPGQVIDEVEIVLTEKVTELTGMVIDERGQPATDAAVVVFADNKARWTAGSRYVRTTKVDTGGKYELRLTPGESYLALAVRNLEDGQYADPEFLQRASAAATSAGVSEGQSRILNLRVTAVP
jgi:hypothetical protein